MNEILCSTGALLGRPNGRDYRQLDRMAERLTCDGFEFMIYGSWYPEFEELLRTVRSMGLHTPVVHCRKTIGESLCGMRVWCEGNTYPEYIMTEEEDRACFAAGKQEFLRNLQAANALGAQKMVIHLWNGLPSDKRIEKNVERYGELKSMARQAGIELLVENVLCNCHDPLSNWKLLREQYPEIHFIYDTKMAQFHRQTLQIFEPEWDWILREGHIRHLHINDYDGGYMDWGNFHVLPIGQGDVDFDTFFEKLFAYGYEGDYTIEATAFDDVSGAVDFEMLNRCVGDLRKLIRSK